jgi:ADP-ribose pyrophosphatase YjhB (NUDIX family)
MDILRLLDEIRILAANGLKYADNEYDQVRYARLRELVEENYAEVLELPREEVRDRLRAELGHITPKVGGDGAIFDDSGRILLMRRSDNHTWCLPCGWVDPEESPSETVVREVREETGLDVRPARLVGFFHRPASVEAGPHGVVSVLFLCEVKGGVLSCSSEGLELRYWEIEDVPEWHAHHELMARAAREVRGGNGRDV